MAKPIYKKPQQARAIENEQKFLISMNELLRERSFTKLSIDDIAKHAQLERGVFLKRFGSKKQALLLLWQKYCDACAIAINEFISSLPNSSESLEETCTHISQKLENLQHEHFSANRAINEHFMEDLKVAEPTKLAFMQSVNLMQHMQKKYLQGTGASDVGAFSAAQISLTINYNYTIRAMPALPKDPKTRHCLIGSFIATALKL